MINYIKTTNGYFYKICKNGKKRISEDEYNKRKKLKKMMGGMFHGNIHIIHPKERKDVMENVFLTGDISANDKSSFISHVSRKLYNKLHKIRIARNESTEVDIIYVGEIEYNNNGGHGNFHGTSNIWIQHGYRSGKVIRYIVEIIKNDGYLYENHVRLALETLCNRNCSLLIEALRKMGIVFKNKLNEKSEMSRIAKIDDEMRSLKEQLRNLQDEKNNIRIRLSSPCNDFNWTFFI